MGTFNTKKKCAYRRFVPVRHFGTELRPLISYAVYVYRAIIVSALFFSKFSLKLNEISWKPSILDMRITSPCSGMTPEHRVIALD
jgi:hypothetical protein